MISCSDWSALCSEELHHHNGILSQLLLEIRIHSLTIRFLVRGAIFVVVMSALGRSSGTVQQTCCARANPARCHEARYRWSRSCCMVEHRDRSVHMEEKMTTLCRCGGKCSL